MNTKELKAFRKKWKITKAGLGRMLDYDINSIIRWEKGEYPVPVSVERALACWDKNGIPDDIYALGIDWRYKKDEIND